VEQWDAITNVHIAIQMLCYCVFCPVLVMEIIYSVHVLTVSRTVILASVDHVLCFSSTVSVFLLVNRFTSHIVLLWNIRGPTNLM
jgi:hypothetical protein